MKQLYIAILLNLCLNACTVQVADFDKPLHTNIKDWYLPPCDQYEEGSWAEYKCKANSGQGSHQ